MTAEGGQAQIEALAAVLAVAFVVGLGVKTVGLINTTLIADASVHAGALAQAAGGDAERAARRALPPSRRRESRVRARQGVVTVAVPLAGGRSESTIDSRAWSRPPGG